MRWFRSLSLRHLLTVPYVVLVVVLAVLIGLLSYRAGRSAIDNLSGQLLSETVGRIAQAVEKHVFGSAAVLEVAFPAGLTAPPRLADEVEALRTRFWQATSVHRELNNYAYYGDEQGHFFGLWRDSADEAQVRLRTDGQGPRTLYKVRGIRGPLTEPTREERVFEPRERPWYRASRDQGREVWTSIYIGFRTEDLVATRARRVPAADGSLGGVVATDVSLQSLTDFVRSLPLSRHGLAFVAEPDGQLIATSRGAYLRRGADGRIERLGAESAEDPLLVATHRAVRERMAAAPEGDGSTRTAKILGPDGAAVQVAWARIRDSAGLDWVIAVAVPRSDFLQDILDNAWQTVGLAVLAVVGTVAMGLFSLGLVSRDLRQLSQAARRVGEGDFGVPLAIRRADEIGDLAQSFATMTHRLSTDRLTGLANREAAMRRLEDRIAHHRRADGGRGFALLFMDVDRFKAVNDRLGHEAGDRVLVELGQRLQAQVRGHDLLARWAGDEFVVVLDGIGQREDAERVAHKLRQALQTPLAAAGGLGLGLSVGIALYPQDGQDVQTLLHHADQAMYEDKPAP